MPSQIGNDGNVVDVTANYLKTKPSTRFATRQLAFMDIQVSGIQNNYEDSNSLFTQVVRGVQLVAEVYAVGTPHSNHLVVIVAADTNAAQDEINSMAQSLGQQFNNQGISALVNAKGLYGLGFVDIGSFSDYGNSGADRSGLRPPYEDEDVGRYD